MPYYNRHSRSGTYWDIADGVRINSRHSVYSYKKIGENALHQTSISTVWLAESKVPGSDTTELCVIKETDAIIEDDTLTKSSEESVDLGSYLLQLSRVSHVNLVKFYGYARTPRTKGTFGLVLISEYCRGMLHSCKRRRKPNFSSWEARFT